MANPDKLSRSARFQGSQAVQMLYGSGTRVNATATAIATAAAAIPAGGRILIVRATDAVWIRFGTSGVGAPAADANSILFLGGEAPTGIADDVTHFRVLRVGAADVAVQLESVVTA